MDLPKTAIVIARLNALRITHPEAEAMACQVGLERYQETLRFILKAEDTIFECVSTIFESLNFPRVEYKWYDLSNLVAICIVIHFDGRYTTIRINEDGIAKEGECPPRLAALLDQKDLRDLIGLELASIAASY